MVKVLTEAEIKFRVQVRSEEYRVGDVGHYSEEILSLRIS